MWDEEAVVCFKVWYRDSHDGTNNKKFWEERMYTHFPSMPDL
jgi:hypothetical protein